MDDAEKRAVIGQFVHTAFAAEQQAGFPVLQRVPDTQVIRFLDHYNDLDRAEQSALTMITCDWSAYALSGGPPPNPHWQTYQQATAFPARRGGRRYTGVQLLAGLAKDGSHGGLDNYFRMMGYEGVALQPPPCVANSSDALVPIGAASLRRKVNTAFAALFAPTVTDLGSEIMRYEGTLDGFHVKVDIRYSGKMGRPQLAYSTQVRGKGLQLAGPGLSFESALGVGSGNWDYITTENADSSVTLLCDLIRWIAQLPERLPPGTCDAPSS